jgi:hypothetical protein
MSRLKARETMTNQGFRDFREFAKKVRFCDTRALAS